MKDRLAINDRTIPAEWAELLEEFGRRRDIARAMGRPETLDQHRAAGKLNACEILALFCDEGSFMEHRSGL